MWVKYGRFEFDTKDVAMLTYQKAVKALPDEDDEENSSRFRSRREQKEGYWVNLRDVHETETPFLSLEQREDLLRKMKVTD